MEEDQEVYLGLVCGVSTVDRHGARSTDLRKSKAMHCVWWLDEDLMYHHRSES